MILKRERAPVLARGIVIVPSAFTLANLFFGIYAMVAADRGDFVWAAWFIVFAAISDTFDGRIARFTRTGSRFGAELDSLVDAISFGVAPAFVLYQLYFSDGWGWLLPFAFIAAVVIRLARFNVEQGGEAKRHFLGMPSPAAGITLVSFYPFSQTPLFAEYLSGFAWPQILAVMIIGTSVLLVSHIPYPPVPRIGLRTPRGIFNLVWISAAIVLAIAVPRYYFFPAAVAYTCLPLGRSLILGTLDRLPDRDPLIDEADEDSEEMEARRLDYADLAPEIESRSTGTTHTEDPI